MLLIEHVKKTYPSFVLDLNLSVPKEGITGIVGPNGSGKTTLIKSILGLIKPDEISGKVFDSRLDQLSSQDKERIGVVFSESGFCEVLNVKQVKSILSDLYPAFDGTFFEKLVDQFRLPLDKKISDLSSGQKNMVKLIAALTHHAQFLILDEPTSGLDVTVRAKILSLLADYSEKEHASILITSHISSDLETFCDDLYLIKEGKNILHDRMDHILEDYGIIKSESLPDGIEEEYILAKEKMPYGYRLLTNQKQFFRENYPDLTVDDNSLDELQLIMFEEE